MRFIIIESTMYLGKFSVYDTLNEVETPCYNYATARTLCDKWNKESGYCEACDCDPCDCHGTDSNQ